MKTFTCTEMGGVCDAPVAGETMEDVMKAGGEHVQGMDDDAHKELHSKMEAGGEAGMEEWKKGFAIKWEAKAEDAA